MNRYSNLGRLLEGLLFILIILVIFETYGEELAVFLNLNVGIRKLLLLAGFCFDVIRDGRRRLQNDDGRGRKIFRFPDS